MSAQKTMIYGRDVNIDRRRGWPRTGAGQETFNAPGSQDIGASGPSTTRPPEPGGGCWCPAERRGDQVMRLMTGKHDTDGNRLCPLRERHSGAGAAPRFSCLFRRGETGAAGGVDVCALTTVCRYAVRVIAETAEMPACTSGRVRPAGTLSASWTVRRSERIAIRGRLILACPLRAAHERVLLAGRCV
jgi:hypothetical protein